MQHLHNAVQVNSNNLWPQLEFLTFISSPVSLVRQIHDSCMKKLLKLFN